MVFRSNGNNPDEQIRAAPRYHKPHSDIQISDRDVTVLVGVQSDQIKDIWPFIEQRIVQACERSNGRHRPADLMGALLQAQMQLWVIWKPETKEIKGIGVTETVTYRSGLKSVRIVLITGKDRPEWVGHLKTLEDWGRSVGCQIIEAWARPGWEKELQDYRRTHVLLEKRL